MSDNRKPTDDTAKRREFLKRAGKAGTGAAAAAVVVAAAKPRQAKAAYRQNTDNGTDNF